MNFNIFERFRPKANSVVERNVAVIVDEEARKRFDDFRPPGEDEHRWRYLGGQILGHKGEVTLTDIEKAALDKYGQTVEGGENSRATVTR